MLVSAAVTRKRSSSSSVKLFVIASVATLVGCGPTADVGVAEQEWILDLAGLEVAAPLAGAPDERIRVLAMSREQVDAGNAERDFVAVAVDEVGTEEWRTSLGRGTPPLALGSGPSVGPEGGMWACLGDEATRVTATGKLAWSADVCGDYQAPGACWGRSQALAPSGHYVVVGRKQVDGFEANTLAHFVPVARAVASDGTLAWERDLGQPSACEGQVLDHDRGTEVESIAIDGAGDVVVGCDVCGEGPSIVRLSVDNANVVSAWPVPWRLSMFDDFTEYQRGPVVGASAVWVGRYELGDQRSWNLAEAALPLDVTTAPLWYGEALVAFEPRFPPAPDERASIYWNGERTPIDAESDGYDIGMEDGELIAVDEDENLVLGFPALDPEKPELPRQLALISRSGEVVWYDDQVVFTHWDPLVFEGRVVFASVEGQLVARSGPYVAVAEGWAHKRGSQSGTFAAAR